MIEPSSITSLNDEPEETIEKDEITITILGNANSGKSSLVGVLTNPKFFTSIVDCLDDGNGKSRSSVMVHGHEKKTGRTSSITYKYMFTNNRTISFVDLAGHEPYLKTTVSGVSSSYPDYAIVCVEKSVTKITIEHIGILINMKIPMLFLFTKADIISNTVHKKNISKIKSIMKNNGKMLYKLKCADDIAKVMSCDKLVPYFPISSKTGNGMREVYEIIKLINKRKKVIPGAFIIENIFQVSGYGTVITGITGIPITKGMELYIGPFNHGEKYIKTKVRTIHDDYRNFKESLNPITKGCLCVKVPQVKIPYLQKGMFAVKKIGDIEPVSHFNAEIAIFTGHSTSIKVGYSTYINAGIVNEAVYFSEIKDIKTGKDLEYIRSGDKAAVKICFIRNPSYVIPGSRFMFREGKTKGIGIIEK
jgi:GTPase